MLAKSRIFLATEDNGVLLSVVIDYGGLRVSFDFIIMKSLYISLSENVEEDSSWFLTVDGENTFCLKSVGENFYYNITKHNKEEFQVNGCVSSIEAKELIDLFNKLNERLLRKSDKQRERKNRINYGIDEIYMIL